MDHLTARNPDGTPAPPQQRATAGARPSLLVRLKCTEPVRLYGYGAVLLAAVALVPLLASTSWSPLHTWAVCVLAAVAAAVEAIRASVYPPAAVAAMVLSGQPLPLAIPSQKDANA